MQHRKNDFLDRFAAIYLLASVGLALGFLFIAFSKGVELMGAPHWAWIVWSIGLLLAINIAHFVGERRHTKPLLAMGCIPLLLFVLTGAMETTAGTDPSSNVLLRDLLDAAWFIALVIAPSLVLVVACVGWYERCHRVVTRAQVE